MADHDDNVKEVVVPTDDESSTLVASSHGDSSASLGTTYNHFEPSIAHHIAASIIVVSFNL
jgi:hypothetical protein